MNKLLILLFITLFSITFVFAEVETKKEIKRIPQFVNEKVRVWKTIIPPGETLPIHRHDRNRVVVAFTDGVLKVTNQKGESKLVTLKRGKAYYLTPDLPGEFHSDVNVSDHDIKVMVTELQ